MHPQIKLPNLKTSCLMLRFLPILRILRVNKIFQIGRLCLTLPLLNVYTSIGITPTCSTSNISSITLGNTTTEALFAITAPFEIVKWIIWNLIFIAVASGKKHSVKQLYLSNVWEKWHQFHPKYLSVDMIACCKTNQRPINSND